MDKMIAGGLYQFTDYRGVVVQGTMVSVERHPSGLVQGTLICHGHAPEQVLEDSERFSKIRLIGRPASPKVGRPRKE